MAIPPKAGFSCFRVTEKKYMVINTLTIIAVAINIVVVLIIIGKITRQLDYLIELSRIIHTPM